MVQVGLDVCSKSMIAEEQLARIEQTDSPTMNLLTKITPQLAGFYRDRGILQPGKVVGYNDIPASAYAIDPSLFDIQEYHVRISTHDELTKGQTVTDVKNRWGLPPNTKVLMDVEADRLTGMFVDRVTSYRQ